MKQIGFNTSFDREIGRDNDMIQPNNKEMLQDFFEQYLGEYSDTTNEIPYPKQEFPPEKEIPTLADDNSNGDIRKLLDKDEEDYTVIKMKLNDNNRLEIVENKNINKKIDSDELVNKLKELTIKIEEMGTEKDLKFFYNVMDIVFEIVDLLVRKNHDYGDDNLVKHGLLGIIVRLDDKLARLNNLYKKENKNGMVTDEKIEDTIKDIIGYGLNSLRLMREGRI